MLKVGKILGHTVSSHGSLVNLEPVIKDVKVRTNVINNQICSASWQSKVMLFNSQCMSLYGCQLSSLDDPWVEELSVAWRVCCRRLLALHWLPHIMNSLPVRNAIKNECCFFIVGLKHPVQQLSKFFKNVLTSSPPYMLPNINSILQAYNTKYYELFECSRNFVVEKLSCTEKSELEDWQGERAFTCLW